MDDKRCVSGLSRCPVADRRDADLVRVVVIAIKANPMDPWDVISVVRWGVSAGS